MMVRAGGSKSNRFWRRLNPQDDARKLEEIAAAFLRYKGVEPRIDLFTARNKPRHSVAADRVQNCYPLLLTPLHTEREKTCEKCVGQSEEVTESGMSSILAVRYRPVAPETLVEFIRSIETFVSNPDSAVDKLDIVKAMSRVVPEFDHLERSQMLDQRM